MKLVATLLSYTRDKKSGYLHLCCFDFVPVLIILLFFGLYVKISLSLPALAGVHINLSNQTIM